MAARAKDDFGLAALLIRPDGVVAWTRDRSAAQGRVEAVTPQWF
jgi:hypothetical protein